MKRSGFLKRTKPLRQRRVSGPDIVREPTPMAVAVSTVRPLHRGSYAGGTTGAVPKSQPVRSEEYRRLVAALPCKHCGIHGYSQAAHPNTGKGGAMKTDDRLCFPLCTVHPSPGGGGYVRGCHERFDQGALYDKESRRLVEPAWGADTRMTIEAMGTWPARLPMWNEN